MQKLLFSVLVVLFSFTTIQGYSQGCMDSGDETVKIIGFAQPQFNLDMSGLDKDGNSIDGKNSFLFNRARFGVTGNIPYDITYYATIEFSPMLGGPYMCDVFVTYTGLGPWANLTLGQYKPPFGLELSTPCHQLHTINRSLVVSELASPFRDMGFMVWGGTGDKLGKHNDVLKWYLAIMNGTGINELDDNAGKDIVARVVVSPWEFLKIGGSFKTGKQKPASPDVEKDDERTRFGADIDFNLANFIVQAEYIYGEDKGSSLEGGGCGQEPTVVLGDFIKNGFFAQALYMTPIRLQPVIKYEYYTPNQFKTESNAVSTWTVGFNYFLNDWSRVQVNYLITDNNAPVQYYQGKLQIQVQAVIP
jgi:hypothetical protein